MTKKNSHKCDEKPRLQKKLNSAMKSILKAVYDEKNVYVQKF